MKKAYEIGFWCDIPGHEELSYWNGIYWTANADNVPKLVHRVTKEYGVKPEVREV